MKLTIKTDEDLPLLSCDGIGKDGFFIIEVTDESGNEFYFNLHVEAAKELRNFLTEEINSFKD